MQCNCEHGAHEAQGGCKAEAERVIKTCYGSFELCEACYKAGHMRLEHSDYKGNGRSYRGPSLKALMEGLRLDKGKAEQVRGLIKGTISPDSFINVHSWVKRCYNRPRRIERVLEALNQVLGTFGTEALYSKHSGGGFWQGCRFVYLNAGDTYALTLIYDTELEYFRLGSWGDLVEAGRYGIE